MPWDKVFISHSGQDNDIINQVDQSLRAIGIKPFLAERYLAAGGSVIKKVTSNIRDSNVFIPFITSNSIGNQWVNQEIGYAYHVREVNAVPHIVPVVEEGIKFDIKGFLGVPSVTEYIPFERFEPETTSYQLLLNLRAYINRNVLVLRNLTIACPRCSKKFSVQLPHQELINEAVKKKVPIEISCSICNNKVRIEASTLLPQEDLGFRQFG